MGFKTDIEESQTFGKIKLIINHLGILLVAFVFQPGCPHQQLSDGPIMQRLASRQNRLLLLDFLITELEALRMIAINKPDKLNRPTAMEVEQSVSRPHTGSVVTYISIKP